MSGKLLEKYTARGPSIDDAESISNELEDLGAFGFLRGVRERSLMIELRKKDGHILALGYGFIDRLDYESEEGIGIFCGNRVIRIKGRNLNTEIRPQVRLFQSICQHRVPWILEADHSATLLAQAAATVIERIEW